MSLLTTLLNLLALQGANSSEEVQSGSVEDANCSCNVQFLLGLNNETFRRISRENFKFDETKPIKIIIHDWCDNADSPWIHEMQKVMSETNRWHVIAMDWADSSQGGFSERNDRVAGKLKDFTIGLLRLNAMRLKFVHFIGHGVGAVIGIQAAYKIALELNKKVSRISALDPTLRLTSYHNIADDVKQVADFVDAIHTNSHQMGTEPPIGHVDFYVNGGQLQPDCGGEVIAPLTNAIKKDRSSDNSSAICSHVRACEYWIASIKDPHAFRAFNYNLWRDYVSGRCGKLHPNVMGIAAHLTMPWGSFYVPVTSNPPYIIAKFHSINK